MYPTGEQLGKAWRCVWDKYVPVLEEILMHSSKLPAECIAEIVDMMLCGPPACSAYLRLPWGVIGRLDPASFLTQANPTIEEYAKRAAFSALQVCKTTLVTSIERHVREWETAKAHIQTITPIQPTQ